ncbi:probable cysteine--tRNA ligase, mitochondrial isoform X4 [Equus caballus]|uniref:cysteine--tRNA ligase n=2 Tax=Equus caballus TaxID=9796 RepID=A0A9L0TV81_HORSE|nr:probable cysteine--tRNA ligase, mitochondrial isoform X1 [Equus caballus]
MQSSRGALVGAPLLRAALGLGLGPGPRRAASEAHGQGWLQPAGYDTGVKVYNSRTRRKDPLIVGSADATSWYSCGPTVYDHAHLGHACSYVRFDIIRRILTRVFGCNIIMVMGITDVDDKIIRRAREMNVSPTSLANLYEEDFKQDMAALKILPPTVYLRVTENIPQIISFIEGIIAKGHAYSTAKGNVYFDLQSRGDKYGKLVGVAPGPVGEPVESDKRHASDFALWKAAKPQEMFWASPWGNGRPGWHIECSTISSLVFGSQLDIHSGGIDLAFPHHENEIAQCEVFHQCKQWGNYFLHSGHLHVKGKEEKMSKSLKNYITIKDFLKTASPDVFRLFCMRSSYRSGELRHGAQGMARRPLGVAPRVWWRLGLPASAIDYSDGAVLEAKHLLLAATAFVEDARAYMRGQLACGPIGEDVLWERLSHTKGAVKAALADDFDTPGAVDAVMDLIHHGNRQLKAVTKEPGGPRSPAVFGSIVSYIEQFFETVGISLADRQFVSGDSGSATLHSVVEELVRFRLKVRQFALATGEATREARRQQLLERQPLLEACDTLRQDLVAHGISIKDRSSTSTWELLGQRAQDHKPGS